MLVFLLVLTSTQVQASIRINETNRDYVESRIYNTTDRYVLNWTTDGNEYRSNKTWDSGVRRVQNNTFANLELDPHYAQIIEILQSDENNQFTKIRFMLLENPDNPYPERTVPFRACVNTTKIFGGRRFEQENTFCPETMTQYGFDRVQFNNWYTVRFIEHPKPYVWWFGEDDYDGTFGQGGIGDGLPTCSGIVVRIQLNQTQTYVGSKYTHKIRVDYITAPTGCSISSLEAQQLNDLSQWRVIPTTTTNNTNLNCTGTSCAQTSPAWNTWYTKTVTCTEAGNRTTRTRAIGSPYSSNSATRNMECLPIPEPEPEPVTDIIDITPPPKNRDRFNPLFFTLFPLMAFVMIQQKNKEKNTPPPE